MAVSFSRQSFKPRGGKTIASRMTMHSVTAGQSKTDAVSTMFDVAERADTRRRVLEDDVSKIRDMYASAQFKRATEHFNAAGRDTTKPPVLDVTYVDVQTAKPLTHARGLRFAGGATYVGGLLSVDRRGLRLPPMYTLALQYGESPTSLVPVIDGRAAVSVPISFSPSTSETARLLEPVASHVVKKLGGAKMSPIDPAVIAQSLCDSLASVLNAVRGALDTKLPVNVDSVKVVTGDIDGDERLLSVVEIGVPPSGDRIAWLIVRSLCESGRLVAFIDPAVSEIAVEIDDVSVRDVPQSMFADTSIVSCTYNVCRRVVCNAS